MNNKLFNNKVIQIIVIISSTLAILLLAIIFVFIPYNHGQENSATPTLNSKLIADLITLQAATITPTPLPQPAATFTPKTSPTEAISPTATPPEEHHINMNGHRQYFKIGCEASAAVDWATYFGTEIVEFDFQYKLPISDNPDYGFVGSVDSPWGQVPPYAYGVHAGPIADLLNQYQVPAKAVTNYSLEEVKTQLARDNPIIAWVIGNMVGGIPAEYTDSQGRKTTVAAYEHVVILTGYNEETQRIRYLNNGKFYEIPYDVFLNSWNVLGRMAVVRD